MIEITARVSGLPANKDTPAMVFLAGFPDDHASWADLAPRFATTHTIITLVMPDYDKGKLSKAWGYTFPEIDAMVHHAIEKHTSKSKFVTLVGHDWGALVTNIYVQNHADGIKHLISLDIGAGTRGTSPLPAFTLMVIVGYQFWLALAFICSQILGWIVGDLMMVCYPWKWFGPCPYETKMPRRDSGRPGSHLCYPYYQIWKAALLGKGPKMKIPTIPNLFLYGKNKRIMFHTESDLQILEGRADCRYKALDCGHWVQCQKTDEVEAEMRLFLGI